MRKFHLAVPAMATRPFRTCLAVVLFLVSIFSSFKGHAQSTTLATNVSAITYLTSDSAAVVFGVRNTNSSPITITELANYVPAGFTGVFELWYHPTAVTGAPSAMTTANGWIQVPVSGSITNAPASGVVTLLSGFSLTIPANTTYRLAFYTGAANFGPHYGSANSSGTVFVANGVELYAQNNAASPTYVAGNTPRTFYGSITFSFANTCTDPPVVGQLSATTTYSCPGSSFSITPVNSSNGTGQTYQWESSPDNTSWTPISGATSGTLTTTQTSANYYRVKVTCGANTVTSTSIQIQYSAQLGGNYTINPALPASASNFTSFAEAVSAMRCGISSSVVFDVAPNTYTEQVVIPSIAGTSATKTVKFRGNLATISFNSTNTNQRAGITLDGADYVTIDSLIINANAGTYGWGVHLINGANYNQVTNCQIELSGITSTGSSNSAGIVASGSFTTVTTDGNASNNKISGNNINGGYVGIIINGTATSTLAVNNEISNNIVHDFYQNGIELTDNDGSTVSGNNISRAARVGVTTFTGIELGTGNKNVKVFNNRIHDTHNAATTQSGQANGIASVSCDAAVGSENLVYNNLIYNFNSLTGVQYGLYNSSSDGVHYFHNTVVFDYGSSTSGTTRGFYQTTASTNIIVKNNIIYITRAGTGTKHALYFGTTSSTIVSNNNVLYVNPPAGSTVGIGSFGTTNSATLATWRTVNGGIYDAQSSDVDPQFADPSNGNFKPAAIVINNMGANVGIATDILGIARLVASPDPGAYEFSLSGCANPPTAGAATTTAATICPGTGFTLDLAGNSIGDGQTYQWQTSTDNLNWVNAGSASTATFYTTTQTATTYYRAAITCNAGTTVYSASVLVTTPALVSGTFTINPALPASSTNFQNLTSAVNAIRCGINGPVVFNIAAGSSFNEQVTIPAINGTSATNTIRFNGNGALLGFNSTLTDARSGILLNGADHIIIDSLNIDASAGTYGWGIHFMNGADNNTITRCRITSSSTGTSSDHIPVVMSGSLTSASTSGNNGNNNTISGNTLIGGYYSIVLYGSSASGAANQNNAVLNNKLQDSYTHSVYMLYQTGAIIRGNDISRPVRANSTTIGGIYMSTGVINTTVEKNSIHHLFSANAASTSTMYGIYISADGAAGMENKILNNQIYGNEANGVHYGIYNTSAPYVNIYHNTISHDYSGATAGNTYGLYQTGTATNINFKNNIIYITRGGTGLKYGIYKNTAANLITSNYNIFFLNSSGAGAQNIGFETTDQLSLGNWQTTTAQDMNSIVADPQFAGISSGNLYPNNPVLDSKGIPVGVLTDILGATRDAVTPDPGAYEIILGGCVNPPTPGTATTSTAVVCPGATFTLDLTGNSAGVGQLYQWQMSMDQVNWTDISSPSASSAFSTTQPNSMVYRAAVTCNNRNVAYSSTIMVLTPALVSGNFTIDPAQPTGGANFQTIADAVNYIRCGVNGPVVFNMASGSIFNEQVTIPQIPGASAVNTIRFNGNSALLSFNSTSTNQRAGILLDGADHIIIDSLNIDGSAGTYAWGVHLMNDADSNIITKCRILVSTSNTSSSAHSAVVMSNSTTSSVTAGDNGDYNKFTGNTFVGGYYTVALMGNSAAGSPSVGNEVSGNRIQESYTYNIYAGNQKDAVISNNDISRPSRTTTTTVYGVYLTTGVTNATVAQNRVHNMFDAMPANASTFYGIYISSAGTAGQENRIINNAIYGIQSEGTQYGIYNSTAPYTDIYHNTIAFDHVAGAAGTSYGFYQTGTTTNINFRNNILYITRGGTGSKYGIYKSSSGTAISSNNNIFFINSAGSGTQGIGYQSGNQATLAAWQTASGQDAQSLVANPLFVSASNGNLRPNNSVIESKGAALGITTDIIGNPRDLATPEPGAYEMIPVSGIDLGITDLLNPLQKNCYGGSDTVVAVLRNFSAVAHDLSANPVTINVSVTGAAPSTPAPVVINSGTLAPGATMNVTISNNFPMNTAGAYTFSVSSFIAGDLNTSNDTLAPVTRTVIALNAGTLSSNRTQYCVTGGIPTLTLNGATGAGSVQWQESTTATGPWTNTGTGANTYTPSGAISTSMYYRATVNCGTGSQTTPVLAVLINDPQVLTTTSATRCGDGSVALQATANAGATLQWFTTATGSTPVFTGNNFVTPVLNDTTLYYVAATTNSEETIGAASPAIGTISSATTAHWMNFQANAPVTIQSVDLYFSAAIGSAFTITVRDAATLATVGSYPGTSTVSGNSTAQTVPVNISLAPGNYQMGFSVNPGVYRNTTGAVYPYTQSGNISITGNTFDPDYYYYFYRWMVSSACTSPRVSVAANVGANTVITSQPAAQTVCAGSPVTFSVSATGAGTPGYQWKKNGVSISGATGATYTIASASAADAGQYSVVVGSCDTLVSIDAALVVNSLPVITSQPQAVAACSGSNAQFSVTATGSGLSYQWRKDGVNIASANAATLTLTGVSAADPGNYDVVISGCGTDVTSNAVALTLNATPAMTTQPAAVTACAGSTATFTAAASGSGLSYQWRYNNVNMAGATNATYSISNLTAGQAGNYDVVVTNNCGSVSSNVAALTVNAATSITTAPASQAVCAGTPASFSVSATGSGTLTYQWLKNGANITGANTATFTIASMTASDAADYSVVVTGSCGPVTSAVAVLSMNSTPAVTSQPAAQTICTGNAATFNVTATGTGLSYQWRKGGADISGANSASFTIASVSAASAGSYDVVITGTCGTVTSNTALLTVSPSVTILSQPVAQTICAGAMASFKVGVTPVNASFQWRKAGVNIPGATDSTYVIFNAMAANAGNYDVVVTSSCGNVTSATVALVVNTGGGCATALPSIDADITSAQLMPNLISNGHTVLRLQARRALNISWTITDMNGRAVQQFRQRAVAGRNDHRLSVTGLAAGTYFLHGRTSQGVTTVIRFVKM